MQYDMHYCGTYAMARAAGLTREAAQAVASAAQFVDDLAGTDILGGKVNIVFEDAGSLVSRPTGHHPGHLKNLHRSDQRQVWVPFHFLPGGEGDSFTERLRCQKDSRIAREMVEHHAKRFHEPFGLELAGVTAHVYADTFAHYGFSGVSSRRNKISQDSIDLYVSNPDVKQYIEEKAQNFWNGGGDTFWENIKASFAEVVSGALGHGAAATYPDRPFLTWTMYYEYPTAERLERHNQTTFLEGCEALHEMFSALVNERSQDRDRAPMPFADFRDEVKDILAHEADKAGRVARWETAMQNGIFGPAEEIPEYLGHEWNRKLDELHDNPGPDSTAALPLPVYHFLQAASMHRNYVLRDLLPSHDLVVA
jgi:hypothetical protein